MLTYNNLIAYETKKLIQAEVDRLAQTLILGNAVDYADYKYWVGRINGLRASVELLDEAEAHVEGAPRNE